MNIYVPCRAPSSRVTAAEHCDCFAPPAPYAAALQDTIGHVSKMRAAVKSSFIDKECKHDVQNVIQVPTMMFSSCPVVQLDICMPAAFSMYADLSFNSRIYSPWQFILNV